MQSRCIVWITSPKEDLKWVSHFYFTVKVAVWVGVIADCAMFEVTCFEWFALLSTVSDLLEDNFWIDFMTKNTIDVVVAKCSFYAWILHLKDSNSVCLATAVYITSIGTFLSIVVLNTFYSSLLKLIKWELSDHVLGIDRHASPVSSYEPNGKENICNNLKIFQFLISGKL